eukprot:TRINITY_DN801_c0_g1_i1.p1 TRINITY_DN801_c0_g1~~TRINITY_DN801_c0_g1_i1.p1  ORF type:complete len:147 (-),score=27.92 TRINITY_DN801_c0_g1_i1:86-526(-)
MGGYISSFLCNIVGFAYPTYASFKALESDDKDDDSQWLCYWIVYSLFSVVESFTDFFIFWVPFYYEGKLVLLLALQFPQLKLASTIYHSYIRPILKANEAQIDSAMSDAANNLRQRGSSLVTEKGPQVITGIMQGMAAAAQNTKKE